MDRLLAWVMIATAVSWLAAGPAAAQGGRLSEARTLFDEARAAFEAGEYAVALERFERVYELTGSPELLYNIGVSADRAGHHAEAVDGYERYLLALPDAPDRAEVQARIVALGPGQPETAAEAAVSDADRSPDEPSSGVAPTAAESDSGGPVWAWVAGGLGVALAAGAALLWLDANAAYDELAERCRMEGCGQDDVDASRGPLEVTLTNVGIGLSAAAFATSVLLFFVEGSSGDESSPSVSVGPGSLSLRGAF